MRAAKARKRRERIAAGWTPEPPHGRSERWLEVEFRDRRSGERTGWVEVKSARQAERMVRTLLRDWFPRQKGRGC